VMMLSVPNARSRPTGASLSMPPPDAGRRGRVSTVLRVPPILSDARRRDGRAMARHGAGTAGEPPMNALMETVFTAKDVAMIDAASRGRARIGRPAEQCRQAGRPAAIRVHCELAKPS
jgi:hypothetical protein